MTIQVSVGIRNAWINAIEATVGTSPKLELRTGAQEANCAAAASGTLLATLSVPSDWQTAGSSGGGLINNNPWTGTVSTGGTAAHFRLTDTAGTTCHMIGSVGLASGDLALDNNVLVAAQTLNINTWTTTAGNA